MFIYFFELDHFSIKPYILHVLDVMMHGRNEVSESIQAIDRKTEPGG